ncbi:MAG: ferritin [Prevotella sp.]|jgi:ferritin|uniref:Ferritin n=1 Tax=Segatella cerevisiae TaxID=2053716 RepID=A0ABT1BWA3_9BACT|nr:ferritin [Segatella cerevisiae]MCH3994370.1 ferritin [Prevotella sp.]MCI1246553.1 ferritin [Prevotella sp.]MCO6024528.1 ferritin [Segatella cerevisiae]
MLKKEIEKALNEQINVEMWSAYLYLSMAAYCHSIRQTGMARWFEVQFKEEQDHAKILFNYIVRRNGRVLLEAVEAVPKEWKSVREVFVNTLGHEREVTEKINTLVTLTKKNNDYATESMLQWFIDEQVEEEDEARDIIDKLDMIKENGFGLYMLDKELGERKYQQAGPLEQSVL